MNLRILLEILLVFVAPDVVEAVVGIAIVVDAAVTLVKLPVAVVVPDVVESVVDADVFAVALN